MFRIHVVNGVPIPSKPLIMHLLKDDQKSLSSSFHLCLLALSSFWTKGGGGIVRDSAGTALSTLLRAENTSN